MEKCQVCQAEEAVCDAKLDKYGWAYVCEKCFKIHATKAPGTFTTLKNIGAPGRKPYSD